MKILYFYQYFATPKGSWGTRVYEFAKNWVDEGHEVTVVSSIYAKSDLQAEKLIEDQVFDGINVKVINVRVDNKQPVWKRIWTFVAYSFLSCWYALTMKADVVVASSGPITAGLPGLVARYLRGRKFVFEVRDLWPEGAIELGIIKNSFVSKLAYWFEKRCYKASRLVVSLSPGMRDNILKRYPWANVISVPNSANIFLFSEKKSTDVLPSIYKDKKVAIYTGNIGMVNNSDLLFRAAARLKEIGRNDIAIVMVGEGQQKQELLDKSQELDNFTILDLMPKDRLVALVQNSLASLVPLKGSPVLDTSSPNKLFESLAAGVPVIQTTGGWIKDFLDEEKCGVTVDASDEDQLVEQLIYLADNPEAVKRMGERGKKVAAEKFDKDFLSEEMLSGIEEVHSS